MKKRFLTLAMAVLLVAAFAVPALAATYEATLMGQLDMDVEGSADVGEWGIEGQPGAVVGFELGQQATITMEFANPIKFSSNWTGISTNFPIRGDAEAEATNSKIISIKVDGKDLGSKAVPLIDRDNNGFLTLDISRKWGGDHDAYGLETMAPFSKLEITFMVGEAAAGGGDSGSSTTTGKENPKTGDSMMIYLAAGFLVLAACATVFIIRKAKKAR